MQLRLRLSVIGQERTLMNVAPNLDLGVLGLVRDRDELEMLRGTFPRKKEIVLRLINSYQTNSTAFRSCWSFTSM
jgi:hypothetical protein